MWTVAISIVVWAAAAIFLLCIVASAPKPKEKKDEESGEKIDNGSEEERQEQSGDTGEEFHEDGVKVMTRPNEVATNSDKVETRPVQFGGLDCTRTFENLTPTERLYAHHLARAYFEGALMILLQTSPESAGIFIVLYRIFWFDSVATLKEKAENLGISESEWNKFLCWAASKLTIRGDYVKPPFAHARLWKLVAASTAASLFPDLLSIYESAEITLFSPLPKSAKPGFASGEKNPDAITKKDYDICNAILKKKRLMMSKSRLYKDDLDGEKILRIKVASTNKEVIEETVGDVKVRIEKGNYAKLLEAVCAHLGKASEHSASTQQREMLLKYDEYFQKGDWETGKAAYRKWLKDENPTVHSKFYFVITSGGDPGLKSEFAGFVAAVNKEATEMCSRLKEKANEILAKLPWGKAYEKDKFTKPDFAVVDMIAQGFPQTLRGHNFMNEVNLGRSHVFSNVISALPMSEAFLKEEDLILLRKYDRNAQEVFTGLHELFGHGSGKLFKRKGNGSFNFDYEGTKDLITGEKVTSWYEKGQSYYSVFDKLGQAFEECRAYAVAYMLCCDKSVLESLGYTGKTAQLIKYVIWLKQLRDGLHALFFYSTATNKWRDAHCHARFVLLKVILEEGGRLLTIKRTKDGLLLNLDQDKIQGFGMPAIREFLKKLQAYKSTADVKGATALFDKYAVGTRKSDFAWMQAVVRHELRCGTKFMFVEPNTVLNEEGGVELVTYEETAEGVIQSVIDRYSLESVADLEELWKDEKK